jgi:hypothetical protein
LLTRNFDTICGYDASQVVDFAIDIDSGGWEARRYVPGSGYGKWHPSTDQMVGTDIYGTKGCTTQQWSEEFKSIDFDQFLLISGDKSKWMIITRLEAIGTDAAPAWYSNEVRTVFMSSSNSNQYSAKMYRRSG